MSAEHELVILVDDDPSICRGLSRLLKSYSYQVRCFGSAREFLDAELQWADCCCLVLDVNLPDLSGLDLQQELIARDYTMPIIFITGYGDIPMSVKAMKRGAVNFLSKPVDEADLLASVREALRTDLAARRQYEEQKAIEDRLKALTRREFQILRCVLAGLLNKQIAYDLGISEKTVKAHRGKVMQKMRVNTVAELARIAEKAGVQPGVFTEQ